MPNSMAQYCQFVFGEQLRYLPVKVVARVETDVNS